jgi:hypothetical protein
MDVLEDLRRLGNLRRSNGHNAVDGLRVERARKIYAIRSHAADYFGDCDVRYCWLPGSSRSRENARSERVVPGMAGATTRNSGATTARPGAPCSSRAVSNPRHLARRRCVGAEPGRRCTGPPWMGNESPP